MAGVTLHHQRPTPLLPPLKPPAANALQTLAPLFLSLPAAAAFLPFFSFFPREPRERAELAVLDSFGRRRPGPSHGEENTRMDPPRQDRRHHGRTGAGAARSSPVRRGNAMYVNLVFLHSRPASSSPMTICYITDLLVSLRYLPLTSPARIRTGTIATLRSFRSEERRVGKECLL